MRRFAFAIALSLPSPLLGQGAQASALPTFEFRRHELGQPFAGESDCGYVGPTECEQFGVGINGAAVNLFYYLVDRNFEGFELTFHSDMFAALRDAFVAKYGPPSSTEEQPFETRGGAKATNVVMTWKFAQGMLSLKRFDYSLLAGVATIETERYKAASEEKRKRDAAKAAGKDM
jgi:hypothetical protein